MPSNELPLFQHKDYASASVFRPEGLLREARRQKGLPETAFPSCVSSIRTATSCADYVGRVEPPGRVPGPAITPNWMSSASME